MIKPRIIEQHLTEDGIWTVYESGLQILKPYPVDENVEEFVDLDPNKELFPP